MTRPLKKNSRWGARMLGGLRGKLLQQPSSRIVIGKARPTSASSLKNCSNDKSHWTKNWGGKKKGVRKRMERGKDDSHAVFKGGNRRVTVILDKLPSQKLEGIKGIGRHV